MLVGSSWTYKGFCIYNIVHPPEMRGKVKIEFIDGWHKTLEDAKQYIDRIYKITNAKHVKDLCN